MEHLVPLVLFGCVTGIIIFIASRRHRERIELIKKDKFSYLHTPAPPKTGSKSLFLGIFAVGIGLALLLSAVLVQNSDRDMITGSLLCLFGGGAMLLYWKLTAKDREYARRMTEEQLARLSEIGQIGEKEREIPEDTGGNETVTAQS